MARRAVVLTALALFVACLWLVNRLGQRTVMDPDDREIVETVFLSRLSSKPIGAFAALSKVDEVYLSQDGLPGGTGEEDALSILTASEAVTSEFVERPEIQEAAANLVARMSYGEVLDHYTPRDARLLRVPYTVQKLKAVGYTQREIEIRSHPVAKTARTMMASYDPPAGYQSRFPVRGSVPGYSADRRFAVMYLHFPAQIDPAYATCVLEKIEGRWVIISWGDLSRI
jgi:hypothetical protein